MTCEVLLFVVTVHEVAEAKVACVLHDGRCYVLSVDVGELVERCGVSDAMCRQNRCYTLVVQSEC